MSAASVLAVRRPPVLFVGGDGRPSASREDDPDLPLAIFGVYPGFPKTFGLMQ